VVSNSLRLRRFRPHVPPVRDERQVFAHQESL